MGRCSIFTHSCQCNRARRRKHDRGHSFPTPYPGRHCRCRRARRTEHRARARAALAHGDFMAEALAGARHVGGAHRRARRRAIGRQDPDQRACCGRTGAGAGSVRCGRLRRRRARPHRLVLLAGQATGVGVLHDGAVRHDTGGAHRLDQRRRRAGVVGRALPAVRRQAVHGWKYRHLHGRLVPHRDRQRCRAEGHEDSLTRPWR